MILLKKIFIYIGLTWTFSCLIFQWGCAPIAPYSTPEGFIGNLHVDGANAFLNQKRAYHRMKIYSGDNVTVGAATRVRVMFPDGGFIELDENTDPDFRKWFEAGKCIVKIFFKSGRTYGETGHECEIIVNTTHLEAFSKTKFNMEITPQQTILTVIEGRMMLERPERRPIEQSYQVVVSDQGVQSVRPLSSEELRSVTGWRMGWCCSQGQVLESSPEDCKRRRGFFSYKEMEARERCRSDVRILRLLLSGWRGLSERKGTMSQTGRPILFLLRRGP